MSEKKILITPEVQLYKDSMGKISPIKLAELVGMPLHDIQKNIASYFEYPKIHSFEVLNVLCSRRIGKTAVATKIIVSLMLCPNHKIGLVSHSTSLSDQTFSDVLGDLMKIPSIKDKVTSRKKEGIIEIPELGTRLVTSSYLNAESRFVGKAFTNLIYDEFFLVPANYQEQIYNLLYPTLTTYGRNENGLSNGKIMILSTPRGIATGSLAGLKYLAGEQGVKGHISFKHTIYESPFLTEKEIEEIRLSLPADIWEQEFLCNFIKTSVNSFRNFNKEKHIINLSKADLKNMAQHCNLIVATDYGVTDGSAAVFILFNTMTDTYYIIDEIYVKETVNYDFIKMFKTKAEEISKDLDIDFNSILFFYDASAREAAIVAQQKFNLTMNKARNSGFNGVDFVNQLLQGNGDAKIPKLYILNSCEKTIYNLEYCEHKVVNGVITPQFARDKGELQSHFDLAICVVYGTYSHNKTSNNTLIIT